MATQRVLIGLLCLSLPASLSAAGQRYSAYAEYRINPTGTRETHVIVEVTENANGTNVRLVYNVQSTSEEGDFLFYHSITGGGEVADGDFVVLPGGRGAMLETTIPAFDDEGGTEFEMGLTVIWVAKTGPNRQGTRRAVAMAFFDYPFNSPYFTNVLITAQRASITRLKAKPIASVPARPEIWADRRH